jgi:hypothetical protein
VSERLEITGDKRPGEGHGPSVKNDKQFVGLRKKGMSTSRSGGDVKRGGSSGRGGKQSDSGGVCLRWPLGVSLLRSADPTMARMGLTTLHSLPDG